MFFEKGALVESPRSPMANTASNCKRRKVYRYGKRCFTLLVVMATLTLINLYISDKNTAIAQRQVRRLETTTVPNDTKASHDIKAALSAQERVLKKAILQRKIASKNKKKSVIVFVCNAKYCPAVASSIRSLREDGGYKQDVAVILDESSKYKVTNLKKDLKFYNTTTTKRDKKKIRIFTVKKLFDSLLKNQTADVKKYQNPPAMASCINAEHRKQGHRSYYLKTLMFHPYITAAYDRVLCMDACMTFHSPHVQEILDLPEVEGALLAAPDPWQWQKRGIGGRVLKCADEQAVEKARALVGKNLKKAGYFNGAFILFDAAIVNNYMGEFGSPGSSLLELLTVYHTMTPAWQGNQDVLSTYWVYVRKLYRALPHSFLGTSRIPYDFIRQIRKGKYVISSGNLEREVCKGRPTNDYAAKKK